MGEEEAGAVSGEAQGVGAASGRPQDEVAPARHQAATTTRRAVARPRTTRSGQRAGWGRAASGRHRGTSSRWRGGGRECCAAGTACRAEEVDGDPQRCTWARAGWGSTRGRELGGGARARASEQDARPGRRCRSENCDLWERRKGDLLGSVWLVPAGIISRH